MNLRPALMFGVLAAGAGVIGLFGAPSVHELRGVVGRAGVLGPLLFVAIYVGWTALLLPGLVPTLAAGALFGVIAGSTLALIGALIGAMLAFGIARRLGRARIQRLAGRRAGQIERWLSANGFLALLYARLVPVIPFSALNYAAGLSPISARRYGIATALGIIPGTIVYASVGSSAGHPGSTPFLVSVGALVVLTLLVSLLARRRRHLESRSVGAGGQALGGTGPGSSG